MFSSLEDNKYLVKLTPRFPLLGGWKLSWDLSFNMPSSQHLFRHSVSDLYKLELPVNHLLPSLPTDVYSLEISLPEGAVIDRYEIDLSKDFTASESLTYSYLNYFGRPTLKIDIKDHLGVIDVQAKIRVFYRFQDYFLFVQILYPAVALLLVFSVFLSTSRLSLTFNNSLTDKDE